MVPKFSLEALLNPLVKASEEMSRLDERIARSAIRDGFLERSHFADACASLWVDGELVHAEELVLHDAGQDIRAPSHELTIARDVLRARRRIASEPSDWCFTPASIATLRGSHDTENGCTIAFAPERKQIAVPIEEEETDPLLREIVKMDALLARSDAMLRGSGNRTVDIYGRDPLVYDLDWNEDERLNHWLSLIENLQHYPAVLQAALLLDAWNNLEVFQRQPWMGRLLTAASMRRGGCVSLLPNVNVGLKLIPREQRTHRKAEIRIMAYLRAMQISAEQGLKDHDRLLLAKQLMERRLTGRRSSSRLPEVVKIVLTRPVVSTEMVAAAAQVTQRAALRLIEELNLREVTGRGRFKAWGIL